MMLRDAPGTQQGGPSWLTIQCTFIPNHVERRPAAGDGNHYVPAGESPVTLFAVLWASNWHWIVITAPSTNKQ